MGTCYDNDAVVVIFFYFGDGMVLLRAVPGVLL
jgi:hypothetical protein